MAASCWACRIDDATVKPMAFVEEPSKERFALCERCRNKSPFNDGGLVEMQS